MRSIIASILITVICATGFAAANHVHLNSFFHPETAELQNQDLPQDVDWDHAAADPDHCSHASVHMLGIVANELALVMSLDAFSSGLETPRYSFVSAPPTHPPKA